MSKFFFAACGGKFSDLAGQIASPAYPRSYPSNVECVWELSAAPGNRLILTIEKMDIEQSDKCNEDYLEIREESISGKLVGKYRFYHMLGAIHKLRKHLPGKGTQELNFFAWKNVG